MRELVAQFPNQLKEALEIGANAQLKDFDIDIKNVVISGLGGSGIGGKIVSQIVSKECPVPIYINNTYTIPGFVNENTLFIASSFSGYTEETLMALETAQAKGAHIAAITSGGKLEEICTTNNYNHIIIPPGESPRAMLTYSLTQQFFLLNHYGLIGGEFAQEIVDAVSVIEENIEDIKSKASEIANSLVGKTPIIYASDIYEGVAVRLRQQINENSKMLAWHHVLPEMNHNELVGWAGGSDQFVVLIYRNEDDHPRVKVRTDISKGIISEYADKIIEIEGLGATQLGRSLYNIAFGDWITVHLADLREVDPIEVEVISYLKGELAKL